MTRYPAAPLDRDARIATAAGWTSALALATIGVVVAAVASVVMWLVRAERRTVEAFVTSRAAVVPLRVGDLAISSADSDRLVAASGANDA